ncbi:S24 family peptidase [Dysgonomonas sp. 511]|uniref:S24 family peptidase n=1 Tax=Dysgonomonas sp. 511 TaxID=2302930 RepID=UPI0013D28355|nr:S24 family peptidase [Dysgonomonas sp. 511]NDV79822.1 S24 family peptidase [Dysgonomonas sp. 511]
MLNEQDEYKNESSTSEEKGQKPHYEDTNYKPRPYIDAFYGALGVPNGFTLAVRADECEQISIPFISNYDFSIKGRGDSMINRKNPDRSICDGDLIACRIWTSRSYIQWGQVYALATSQGVVIKQIKESEKEGYIKCVSFNEEDGYTPYDIPVEEIYDWALVVSVTHTAKW